MRNIAFWLSLPFVLPQALWTRATARRFSAPEGPLSGLVGSEPRIRIVGIGDSIIAGVGADSPLQTLTGQLAQCWSRETDQGVEWHALGRIGATTERIGRMAAQLPKDDGVAIVLFSAGVNDITALIGVRDWLGAVDRLVDGLLEKHPSATIVMLGVPPLDAFPALPAPLRQVLGSRARYFDRRIREHLGLRERCRYLPIERQPTAEEFAADGFHPSARSYAALAAQIVRLIRST